MDVCFDVYKVIREERRASLRRIMVGLYIRSPSLVFAKERVVVLSLVMKENETGFVKATEQLF